MEHTPVLLNESIDGLDIRPDGIYVDGTLGRGGHAREIASRLSTGRLIAIDQDAEAIEDSKELLSDYSGRVNYYHGDFADLSMILELEHVEQADGMLFDLGVSSPQIDNIERGFSYMHDATLDMRMDRRKTFSAFDAVNSWTEDELRTTFYRFGEERFGGQIARAIVRKRDETPIRTTFDLNKVIYSAIPPAARRASQHPSKRCYQALRIAINDELGSLERLLASAPERLRKGGRLCIISFHSLEDRLVKKCFSSLASGCVCPKDFPVCVCETKPVMKAIGKKAIRPGKSELERNPRSKSAKLRIAEKL